MMPQKSADLIYTAAEAWSHAQYYLQLEGRYCFTPKMGPVGTSKPFVSVSQTTRRHFLRFCIHHVGSSHLTCHST